MAHEDVDNGEDPTVELEPIRRPRGRPRAEPAPAADVAQTLATALAQAFGQGAPPRQAQPRMPEDRTEVRVRANRRVHIDPAHLAWSQVAGTAYGQDGRSRVYERDAVIVMRPCDGLEALLANGDVRPDRAA